MKRISAAVAVAVVLLVGATASATPIIVNGSFENGTYVGSSSFITIPNTNGSAIAGWTVTKGSVDWIGSYWQASDGRRSLDLSGNSAGAIEVSSGFGTVAGQKYELTFDMAGNPDQRGVKTLLVSVGDIQGAQFTFDTTSTSKTSMGWTTKHLLFTAQGPVTTLMFASGTETAYGPALDNVAVTPVPEPASMLLLGTGLFGMAGAARRRLRK